MLTLVEQIFLLDDFADWSGGYNPSECTEAQILEYARFGPDGFNEVEVANFLLEF